MKTLKIDNVLGLWENETYTLIITPITTTISKKIEEKHSETKHIIWQHILDEENKIHYNTIQVSEGIYIHQLIDNNPEELIINYNDICYNFHRIELINSFKFYRSPKDAHKFIAIRYHVPWEYTIMVEFQDFEIKRILKGESKTERDEIRHCYLKDILTENWIEFNFRTLFPHYKQNSIINEIRNKIQY